MTRPRRQGARREWAGLKHLSGTRALADGVCARCDEPVLKDERVVRAPRGDGWLHLRCASGASDE